MKAKVYIGAKKYAVYIGRKIVEKTMNFFSFPARFFATKDGALKDYKMYGKTVQSNLPEGYTQLESLSSTGYEYINTGLVIQSGDEIQLDYEWLGDTPSSLSADMMFFGCQNIDTTRGGVWAELYRRGDGTRTWYARMGATSSATSSATTEQTTGRHLLTLNQTRLMLDETTLINLTTTDTFQTTPLTLFGRFSQTGTTLNSARIKVFGFKVINNGVVRLNLIPCKNADNILGMYDTVTEQFLANAGTGEFIAGEVIQPTPTNPIAIESVGDRTVNMFNKETISKGAYLNASGQRTANANYSYGDYIKVEPGKTYTISGKSGASGAGYRRIHGYDSSKTWLKQILAQQIAGGANYTFTFTAEEDCEYIRFSGMSATNNYTEVNDVQIEEGGVATEYEPYGYKIPVNVRNKNMFNPALVLDGRGLNTDTGALINSPSYSVLNYTEVKPNTRYTKSQDGVPTHTVNYFYDEDKVFIGRVVTEAGVVETPANAKYLRITFRTTTYDVNVFQIEEGDTATVYEPYFNQTTNIYLSEPLRKLDDYTDYIDFENQKVVRNVYCQTDIYGNPSISAGRYLCNANMEGISAVGNMTITWSNLLQDGSMYGYFEFSNIYNYIGMYRNTNNVSRIVVSKILGCQTVEDFQNALKGIEIYYPLRTPTEESITLPAITLQQGNLSMDTDTKIKPSQLTITGDIDDVR